MGSYIHLDVGPFELDSAKNCLGTDYRPLFRAHNLGRARYHYVSGTERRPAFVSTLGGILPRLELLGHNLVACREQFKAIQVLYYDPSDPSMQRTMTVSSSFDHLIEMIRTNPLPRSIDRSDWRNSSLCRKLLSITASDQRRRMLVPLSYEPWLECNSSWEIDPFLILRLFAENDQNRRMKVSWKFSDLLDGGWIETRDVEPKLEDSHRFLVVTEGSSDALILERSLQSLFPEVSDFFDFVDMTDGYPFTGTGNIYRFCQGLSKIRVQNKILVVLDNDAAGVETAKRLEEFGLPPNMKVAVLPALLEFDSFRTSGPSGTTFESINGRAASIEAYLDHTYERGTSPVVKWTSFNEFLRRYHGELASKGDYVKSYLQRGWKDPNYDSTRLSTVWEHLIAVATNAGGAVSKSNHEEIETALMA